MSLTRLWHRMFGHANCDRALQGMRWWMEAYPETYTCYCGDTPYMDDEQRVIRAMMTAGIERPLSLQAIAEAYWAQDD